MRCRTISFPELSFKKTFSIICNVNCLPFGKNKMLLKNVFLKFNTFRYDSSSINEKTVIEVLRSKKGSCLDLVNLFKVRKIVTYRVFYNKCIMVEYQ